MNNPYYNEAWQCALCENYYRDHTFEHFCDECYSAQHRKEYNRLVRHLKRAQDRGAPATLTYPQWLHALSVFKHRCAYCGDAPWSDLEHFLPIELGGGTIQGNCIPSCASCNHLKTKRRPEEFMHLFPANNIARIREYISIIVTE